MLLALALPLVAQQPESQQPEFQKPVAEDSTQTRRRDRGLGQTLLSGAAAVADPFSATEGTVDAVRWMAKRRQVTVNGTPYGVTGLPIVYYSPSTGWNWGTRLQIADYSRRPYRYKLTLHSEASTADKRNFHVRLKVPHLSGTGFGLNVIASSRRDIRARYYGLSNDSDYNRDLTDPGHPDYIDEDYYLYVLEVPRMFLSLLRHVYGPMTMSFDLGVERTEVEQAGPRSYFREVGTPDGVVDGVTGFVGMTLAWDTRDDPTIPRRGTFHEWSYETSRNSLLGLFFEEIDFQRYTFTDARYWPRGDGLNLAHRTVVEALRGAVPLYAYGEIGGSRRMKGVGGSDSLRGFDRQRFTDNVRLFTNTEARWSLGESRLKKQYIEWLGVVFVDTGQVQPGFSDVGPLDFHVTAGFGLRAYWNEDFVVRTDVGLSSEQVDVNMTLRNLF